MPEPGALALGILSRLDHNLLTRCCLRSRPADYVAYRGTISIESAHLHAGRDSMAYWWGPELHLVQYKVRGGELYNQVGVFRSTTPGAGGDASPPAHEVDAHFSACCEPVRRGAALLDRAMRWPMIDRDPIGNWTRNRITLLGDAAHPMLQYLAQGGCQAIEDGVVLGKALARATTIESGLRAYEAVRMKRSTRYVLRSRRIGALSKLENPFVCAVRDRLLRHMLFKIGGRAQPREMAVEF